MLKWFVNPAKMFMLYDNVHIYYWMMSSMLSQQGERSIFLMLVFADYKRNGEYCVQQKIKERLEYGMLILTWKGTINLVLLLS